MARTKEQLLEQLRRNMPGYYESAEPLLAGFCAALARAEEVGETLVDLATIGNSEGIWLSLQGHGIGIPRASGEEDEAYKVRLRTVEDQVTKPAIKAAVDRIIAPDECEIIEWFDVPYLDVESEGGLWLDNADSLLSGGRSSFIVRIPRQGTYFDFGDHLDVTAWLDNPDFFVGDSPEDPLYAAIVNEVERIRGGGIFWRLVLEE